MKVNYKKTFLVAVMFLENIAIFFVGSMYFEYQSYKKTLENNQGLVEACKNISYSGDFFSTLGELDKYAPNVLVKSNYLLLNFGNEIQDGAGVGLLFDNSYKLIDKFCSDSWENETKDILMFE